MFAEFGLLAMTVIDPFSSTEISTNNLLSFKFDNDTLSLLPPFCCSNNPSSRESLPFWLPGCLSNGAHAAYWLVCHWRWLSLSLPAMCTGNVCRQRVTRQPRRTLHRLGKLLSVETHDALRSSESEVMHNASRTVIVTVTVAEWLQWTEVHASLCILMWKRVNRKLNNVNCLTLTLFGKKWNNPHRLVPI